MENEKAISKLYHEFSKCFVEDRDFWAQLSKEEQEHAIWIKKLLEYVKKGDVKRGTTTLKTQAVETVTRYIDSICEKCMRGEISKVNAYTIALDLENSLLEKKFFSVFLLDVPAHKEVHDGLIRETEKHRGKISTALNKIKMERIN